MKGHAAALALALCLAVIGSIGLTASDARADGCTPGGSCSATVPLTLTPTHSVVGQWILGQVNLGSYSCQPAGFRFHFEATTGTYPGPLTTIDLGFWPSYFRANLPVGVWRISGSSAACYVQSNGNSLQLVTTPAVETVEPKAAQAPAPQAPTQPAPPRTLTLPKVSLKQSADRFLAAPPMSTGPVHLLAAVDGPRDVPPPLGALGALAVVALVTAGLLAYRRKRYRTLRA